MSASSGNPSPSAVTALYAVRAERSSAAAASSSPQVSAAPFAARSSASPCSGKGSTLPTPNLYSAVSASAVHASSRSAAACSVCGSSAESARFVSSSTAPPATAARILFSSSFSQIPASIPSPAAEPPKINIEFIHIFWKHRSARPPQTYGSFKPRVLNLRSAFGAVDAAPLSAPLRDAANYAVDAPFGRGELLS